MLLPKDAGQCIVTGHKQGIVSIKCKNNSKQSKQKAAIEQPFLPEIKCIHWLILFKQSNLLQMKLFSFKDSIYSKMLTNYLAANHLPSHAELNFIIKHQPLSTFVMPTAIL